MKQERAIANERQGYQCFPSCRQNMHNAKTATRLKKKKKNAGAIIARWRKFQPIAYKISKGDQPMAKNVSEWKNSCTQSKICAGLTCTLTKLTASHEGRRVCSHHGFENEGVYSL
uniref:Uncharacterized protein n=1 Tax=Rhipicephalus zambeziensis TaxID=60191 RepID=A0A224YHV9_9ACAR